MQALQSEHEKLLDEQKQLTEVNVGFPPAGKVGGRDESILLFLKME